MKRFDKESWYISIAGILLISILFKVFSSPKVNIPINKGLGIAWIGIGGLYICRALGLYRHKKIKSCIFYMLMSCMAMFLGILWWGK